MNNIFDNKAQGRLEQVLDRLFQKGPVEDMTTKALSHLHDSVAEASETVILLGSLDHTTTGTLFVAMRNNMIVAINFGMDEDTFIRQIENQFRLPVFFAPDETKSALTQIQNYLDGKQEKFDLPTDISTLTEFQQKVLEATRRIPRGTIATYMDIARKIGNPKAVRAVGQALGRNPIPIVIPCHRVIASDGSLGGYSGGGGLNTKAKLLQLEGAQLI